MIHIDHFMIHLSSKKITYIINFLNSFSLQNLYTVKKAFLFSFPSENSIS
jgi:hypothetical protein